MVSNAYRDALLGELVSTNGSLHEQKAAAKKVKYGSVINSLDVDGVDEIDGRDSQRRSLGPQADGPYLTNVRITRAFDEEAVSDLEDVEHGHGGDLS